MSNIAISSCRSTGGSRRRLHQQEHSLHPARWHACEGYPREGTEARAARCGFGCLSARRRVLSSQHLVLADRLGRALQHPHGSQEIARAPCRRHAQHPGRQACGRVESFRDHGHRERRSRSRSTAKSVIPGATIPDFPDSGRIALQHHGSKNKDGDWTGPPSLVQFKNIFIKELNDNSAGASPAA